MMMEGAGFGVIDLDLGVIPKEFGEVVHVHMLWLVGMSGFPATMM
jgi:methanogenic corrinoid protein MtbC1